MNDINLHRYETWDSFLVDAAKPASNESLSSSRRVEASDAFFGTRTFEEALNVARTGWAAGAARVAELRASIDEFVATAKRAYVQQFQWDVTGDFVDVGRVLSGEPEAFGTYVDSLDGRADTRDRVVRLYANLGVSCGVTGEAIFARGAAILAAVDILESAGIRVELWTGIASKGAGKKKTYQLEVLVKSASQPVDVDRLAFVLCHQATLRRLGFSHKEQHGYWPKKCYPEPLTVEEGCIKTPEARRGGAHSREELAAEVANICRECGVEIPELTQA